MDLEEEEEVKERRRNELRMPKEYLEYVCGECLVLRKELELFKETYCENCPLLKKALKKLKK